MGSGCFDAMLKFMYIVVNKFEGDNLDNWEFAGNPSQLERQEKITQTYVMCATPWARGPTLLVMCFRRCRLDNSIDSAHWHQAKGTTVL